jgi:hypothetical protein
MTLHEVRLEELIKRLEAERGMGRKVRLLAGSWPLLSKLSPKQRERVALAVGSRWAWRNLESMFGHPDKLSDSQIQVKNLFERIGTADPDELRELGKEIKKGGIGGAQSRLLGALEHALEENLDAEQHLESPELEPPKLTASGTSSQKDAPTPPPPPPWLPGNMLEELDEPEAPYRSPAQKPVAAAAAVAGATLSKEPGSSSSDEPRQDTPKIEADATPESPAPAHGRTEPEEELPTSSPITSETAAPPSDRPDPIEETDHTETSVEPVLVEDEPAHSRRRETVTLSAVESLHTLQRLSSGKLASSRTSRAALVGSLGSGWAARRAVSSMIRSHAVADVGEALDLIRSLPKSTQQAWCLGDLLQHWQLDDDARKHVLAAAPTPAAKRRLTQRGARAG